MLYSNKLNSEIIFKYGSNGILIGFEFGDEKVLNEQELTDFVNMLPWTIDRLKQHTNKFKIKLTEILPDLTFTNFWNKYNYKDGGSKSKAEYYWIKLSETKRAKALSFIPKYEERLRTQRVAKMYATTYLNSLIYEE